MRKPTPHSIQYELPGDIGILQAYINKNGRRNKSDLRRIRRSLRKLATT